ncbi:hypothetical protein ACTMSW_18505 [Micromonospora sp. BQ11]|uniref:hypothetical protein n=1 Tax=Micromonospora sp. BQ11 TaxID=3452212 RepID=UPI003F89F2C8
MNGARLRAAARWLPAVVVAAAPTAVVQLTGRVWRTRLPDPLPRHWNASGRVDGVAGLGATLTALLWVAGMAAAIALVAALAPGLRWRARRVVIAVAAAVAAFCAGLWLVTVDLALDAPQATAAPGPTWHILALMGGVTAWTLLAAAACGAPPAHPKAANPPPADLERIELRPGQRAVWSEVGSVPLPVYLVLLPLLVIAAVLAVAVDLWVAAPLVITALLVLAVLCTRLTVDFRGVTVGFGPWGWPRVRVPLDEITSAWSTTVRVAEWGGWGYRMNLDRAGRGLILRNGPGVRLELSADRYFVASVRDPHSVAGLVNGMLDAARSR